MTITKRLSNSHNIFIIHIIPIILLPTLPGKVTTAESRLRKKKRSRRKRIATLVRQNEGRKNLPIFGNDKRGRGEEKIRTGVATTYPAVHSHSNSNNIRFQSRILLSHELARTTPAVPSWSN